MADEPVAPTEQNLRNGVSIGGEITFSGGGTILLNEPVEITSDVVIDGGGQVIIDGQKLTTLFVISSPVEVTLRGLTLTKGRSKARTG